MVHNVLAKKERGRHHCLISHFLTITQSTDHQSKKKTQQQRHLFLFLPFFPLPTTFTEKPPNIMALKDTVHKTANVIVFIFFVAMTGYTLFSKDKIADLLDDYQTYFSPARWFFLVWSAIHLLLLGFVAYQWTESAHGAVIDGVGWMFIVSALLNSMWFSLLENNHTILAFIISLFLVFSVSVIFYNLANEHPADGWMEKLFVHAPFSLWHGFTVFLAVLSAFIAFTRVRRNDLGQIVPPDVLHVILVYLALIFLTATALGYVQYKHDRGDVTSAWVIAVSLWAVFDEQHFDVIRWPALAAAILSTIWPVKPYIYKMLGRRTTTSGQETAPLLA
ncbi:hypothetical protein BDB00DRAFT_207124 [Zychaea mexicana]|uniref:uncharacterized protein n=1 Tax=Zychaea mexicana TaxID=64656 RepID=UPI0022FF1806|nr:uncharacterized protein BDB00DRAFT_207124 [Zychaea mexicana]KAI9495619.1 hypothetical protein BDB00DRAFT_207124 [Zychaea mexicana]